MMFSEDNTLPVRLEELKTFLLKQKYPPSLNDDSIATIKALKVDSLSFEGIMILLIYFPNCRKAFFTKK